MLRAFSGWSQALRDPRESPPETPSSQHVHHTLYIVAMGPRRRSRRAPPPVGWFRRPYTPAQPEAPAVPRLEIPAAGITIGHVDTLVVYTGSGAVTAPGITIGHVDTLIVHTGPGPVTDAGRDPEPGS